MIISPQDSPENRATIWLWLSLLVVIADQSTKIFFDQWLSLRQSVTVIPGFSWTLAYNYGAAFSFLNNSGGWQRWFLSVIALGVSVGLVVWLRGTERKEWRIAVPLTLIIGGAIGNVIDRLRLGYVIDFIDVYYGESHWPAFNIADSAISVGAVGLILISLFQHPEKS
jgi:signal peptidase II